MHLTTEEFESQLQSHAVQLPVTNSDLFDLQEEYDGVHWSNLEDH